MSIDIDPLWSLRPSEPLPLDENGAIDFRGRTGPVALPPDYLAFKRQSSGGALRRGRSWFTAQFQDGPRLMQIDWLSLLDGTIASTLGYTGWPDPAENQLVPGFAAIGFDEFNYADIMIGIDPATPDYGKIFAWFDSQDPWMKGGNTLGIGYVADSFTAFMNGLKRQGEP